MPNEATQALAEFAVSLRSEELPAQVAQHCKHLLLDALACALAGHQGEETPQVLALASALAQSEESSVIGGAPLSLAGATLFNGYLVTAVTMCDVHRSTMTHVTPEVIPPALAIAERDACSGRELLAAIAAGCEVTTRVGIGLDYPVFRARGWHGPGILGPFGAAAAVGRLRQFDAETMARAFGLAGSQAAGTFAAWGTPTVKFHQCRGALSGLMAALLAEQDFRATREFITAKDGGLYNAYVDGGKPELVTADLGRRFELMQIALRPWPSASLLQGLATALFDLLDHHAVDPAKVKTMRVALSKQAHDMHGHLPNYKGKFDALISGHFAAAVALHDRALALAQFEPDRYGDAELRRFAQANVELHLDPALTGVETIVDLAMADGTILTSHCKHPRGSFENPLSPAQVEDKFRTYAAGRISAASIDGVIDVVNRLEDLPSTRTLMDLLKPAPRRKGERAA
jgi:2-methylcitrate dehydratase PrpD